MSKAVLIIDMPNSCTECPLFEGYFDMHCSGRNNKCIGFPYPKDFGQDWCPLKEIPNKRDENYVENVGHREVGFIDGWNSCIDEIVGGNDENI